MSLLKGESHTTLLYKVFFNYLNKILVLPKILVSWLKGAN